MAIEVQIPTHGYPSMGTKIKSKQMTVATSINCSIRIPNREKLMNAFLTRRIIGLKSKMTVVTSQQSASMEAEQLFIAQGIRITLKPPTSRQQKYMEQHHPTNIQYYRVAMGSMVTARPLSARVPSGGKPRRRGICRLRRHFCTRTRRKAETPTGSIPAHPPFLLNATANARVNRSRRKFCLKLPSNREFLETQQKQIY